MYNIPKNFFKYIHFYSSCVKSFWNICRIPQHHTTFTALDTGQEVLFHIIIFHFTPNGASFIRSNHMARKILTFVMVGQKKSSSSISSCFTWRFEWNFVWDKNFYLPSLLTEPSDKYFICHMFVTIYYFFLNISVIALTIDRGKWHVRIKICLLPQIASSAVFHIDASCWKRKS